MALGSFALENELVPVPADCVHVPVPMDGIAFKIKSRSHWVPPLPALAVGLGITVIDILTQTVVLQVPSARTK